MRLFIVYNFLTKFLAIEINPHKLHNKTQMIDDFSFKNKHCLLMDATVKSSNTHCIYPLKVFCSKIRIR